MVNKPNSLPKSLKHFSNEKHWVESKKMIAYLISMFSFHFLVGSDSSWEVIAVKALFIMGMYVVFAIAKSVKDVVSIMKQVDAIIDHNKK